MECEELDCVVGGPFKPNKLREVQGLVWRPWINKPSEMTMRCADICHHTTPAFKHKLTKPSLPCPVSHMVPIPPSIHPFLSLSSPLFHFISSALPFFSAFHFNTFIFTSVSSAAPRLLFLRPPSYLHSSISCLPSDSIHPSVHPCMHGWVLYVL